MIVQSFGGKVKKLLFRKQKRMMTTSNLFVGVDHYKTEQQIMKKPVSFARLLSIASAYRLGLLTTMMKTHLAAT